MSAQREPQGCRWCGVLQPEHGVEHPYRRPWRGEAWTPVACFPLRPGRPRVFRRENGGWGYSCICVGRGKNGLAGSDLHNQETWADAYSEALLHIKYDHVAPDSVEALEALFAAPAYSGAGL